MRVSRFSSLLYGLAMAIMLSAPAFGQQYQPLIEPDYFSPDFQFFAPAEFNEYGGEPQPNVGWYSAYDRMYTWVSRPKTEQSYTEGDFTWGNRFDVGYMTQENHGWLFTGLHISGPDAALVTPTERINRWVDLFDTAGGGGGGGGGGGATTQNPVFPAVDRDDPFTFERSYNVTQSLNFARMSGFELSKTWRLTPLHNGSILEPLVGFRYQIFRDWTRRDQYERFTDTGVPVPDLPNPDVALDDALVERLTINEWNVTNHMVGGQLGFRWYKKQVRWVLNSEFRAFGCQNFQSMSQGVGAVTTLYDGSTTNSAALLVLSQQTKTYDHAEEFVFGFDVRAEAAYEVTRDIALRFGANFTEYGRGIGRGNNFSDNSQDLQFVAFTFGVTVNR